jgi:Putative zinc-finger
MSCPNPIDATVLADYWLGELAGPEEEAVEEHLLSCEACGAQLREVIALAEGVRQVAREGALQMVVSETFLKRAEEEGLRVRAYAPPAGGSVQCTVTAEDDLLVGRLAANLSEAKRVDLVICDVRGVEQLRMADIPFAPDAGEVALQQSMMWAKAAPSETVIVQLVEVNDAGVEQVAGEYTFNHTRTLPGPGGW